MKNSIFFKEHLFRVLAQWIHFFNHLIHCTEVKLKAKLEPPPEEWLKKRQSIVEDYGVLSILKFKLVERYRLIRRAPGAVHLPFLSDRERFCRDVLATILVVLVMFSSIASQATANLVVQKTVRTIVSSQPVPSNWLTGVTSFTDQETAFTAAYGYANTAKYPIVTTEAELTGLVTAGRLVPVTGTYVVSDAAFYALPEVATFVNRLGFLYASHGCGKINVRSALLTRPSMASDVESAVAATGMLVSIAHVPTNEREDSFCNNWLKDTLGDIEATRRIDVIQDGNEFQVIVVPATYAVWLKKQLSIKELEINFLAEALFFEAPFKASLEELRAIGWVIKNRAASKYYPGTVAEVIAEGAAGRSAGSCQFSFMCDGKAEAIQLLCGNRADEFWQGLCSDRYAMIEAVAAQVLKETEDPTNGAVLYYAAWLHTSGKAPAWVSDMKPGTVLEIGAHRFACSKYRGRDVCEKGGRS